MRMSHRIVGIEKLGRMLADKAPVEVRKQLAKGVTTEARAIQSEAKALAQHESGQLQKDIIIRRKNKGLTAIVGVFSATRGYIARFLTFGVKPHLIVPRGTGFLKIAGGFAKVVHHPGIKPHDFLLGPSQQRREKFQATMRAAMLKTLRNINS